jgi:hypothetical protein
VSKLRVHNLVVSLDGFATGEGQSLEAAFGHAQQAFMEWFGKIRIWRGLQPDGKLGPDEAIASAWGTAIGAEIMGRNKFRPTAGPLAGGRLARLVGRGPAVPYALLRDDAL